MLAEHSPLIDAGVVLLFAIVAYVRPPWTPYLTVLGLSIQTEVTHWSSDLDTLLGLALGLLLARLTQRTSSAPLRGPVVLWGFAGLNALMLVSYLANAGSADAQQILINTRYFVLRSILVVATVYLAGLGAEQRRRWLVALGGMAAALAVFRILEIAGVPLQEITGWLQIPVLGDTADPGSWNPYAVFLSVGLLALIVLWVDVRAARPNRTARLAWGAALLVVTIVGILSAESRTTTLVLAGGLITLIVLQRSWSRRMRAAAIGLAIAAVGSSALIATAAKPIVSQSPGAAGAPVKLSEEAVTAPGGTAPDVDRTLYTLVPDWRSVLNRTAYRLEQVFTGADRHAAGNFLAFAARVPPGASGITLAIAANGRPIADLSPSQLSTAYRWFVIPVPDSALQPGSVSIDFQVTGHPDSRRNYVTIGGLADRADGILSRLSTPSGWITQDLSSDPGVQPGTLMIFLNGQVPHLTPIPIPNAAVVDPSISDRLYLWLAAVRIFLDHPLTGTGFYTFGAAKDAYPSDHPFFVHYSTAHNNFLQLLADLGFAGPLLLIGTFGAAIWVNARNARVHLVPAESVALAAILVALAASSLTQTWLADSRIYLVCWFAFMLTAFGPAGRDVAASSPELRHPAVV